MYTLREYQQRAVDAAMSYIEDKRQKKPVLMILPTGSGKSLVIAEIARKLTEPLIVFQPTREILEQNYNKMMDYGIMGVTIYSASMGQKDIGNITLATIGSVHRKAEEFKMFKHVIIDECFPKGTLVDNKPIESLKKGDTIRSYNHDTRRVEHKKIKAVSKREAKDSLVRVNFTNGTSFVCTQNHPIYTLNFGYISAISLSLCVEMPLVLHIPINEQEENVLLYGMPKGMQTPQSQQATNFLQRGVYSGREREKTKEDKCSLSYLWQGVCFNWALTYKRIKNRSFLLFCRVRQGIQGPMEQRPCHRNRTNTKVKRAVINKNENQQPYVDAWGKRKDDRILKWEDFSFPWWQRRTHQTTTCSSGGNRVASRISDKNSCGKGFIPKFTTLLQSRFSRPVCEVSNRSGWEDTQAKEVDISRQEEDNCPKFIGVDGCEILERGNRREFRSVCPNGYVYNIEVEDNHNYFVNNILVHNCHLVNAKGGMYKSFVSTVGEKIIGLTATPYRLSHDGFGGSILKFLSRTNPRVFSKVIHVTQTKELAELGFFSKTEYHSVNGFNRNEIKLNSTGADYLEKSEREYYDKTEFHKSILKVVNRLMEIGKKRILVFTKFVAEAESLAVAIGEKASMVNGEMKTADRDAVIKGFKRGDIHVVFNVGVLTVGFDYPELEVVVLARPTRSLTLYYQMIGRCVRPHKDKESAMIVDMCGNYAIFGRVEDMRLVEFNDNIWSVVSNGRQLTNVYLDEIMKN